MPEQSPDEPLRATIERRSSFAGTGCLIQGVGLVGGILLVVFVPLLGWVLGPIVIISTLWAGSRRAYSFECSNCHNPVTSNRVTECPTCHAALKPPDNAPAWWQGMWG